MLHLLFSFFKQLAIVFGAVAFQDAFCRATTQKAIHRIARRYGIVGKFIP